MHKNNGSGKAAVYKPYVRFLIRVLCSKAMGIRVAAKPYSKKLMWAFTRCLSYAIVLRSDTKPNEAPHRKGRFSMAKKRMFSTLIVEDDVFLDMPTSSQNLYFHLCMNADDDGFVSPRKVMRMCNATQDDLMVLVSKRYVLLFASGVCVIKHWHKNNTIRKDRYDQTTYQKELAQLTFNEWGVYTEKKSSQTALFIKSSSDIEPVDENIKSTTDNGGDDGTKLRNGNHLATQYSIDKVSIDKVSNTNLKVSIKERQKIPTEKLTEMMEFWTEVVGVGVDDVANRKACAALIREIGEERVQQLIRGVALAVDDRYAPRIADFVALKRKKNDLILWGRKKGGSNAPARF